MRRLATVTAMLVVLAAAAAGTASAAPPRLAADTFAIHGDVNGLYPGFVGTLNARVTNTVGVPIRISEVTGSVSTTASSGCPMSTLTITTSTTSLDLAPGQSGLVPLEVRMDRAAPDACQGVTYALTFLGRSLAQDRAAGSLAFTGSGTDVLVMTGFTMLLIGSMFIRRTQRGTLR